MCPRKKPKQEDEKEKGGEGKSGAKSGEDAKALPEKAQSIANAEVLSTGVLSAKAVSNG